MRRRPNDGTESKTETTIATAVSGIAAFAGGRTAAHRHAAHVAAAADMVATVVGAERVDDMVERIFVIPVTAPFFDVSVHVVEAPVVGELLADVMGLLAGVVVIPCDFVEVGAFAVTTSKCLAVI